MACMHTFRRVVQKTTRVIHAHLRACLPGGICFGRCPASTPQRTMIVFPCTPCTLTCGLAGMVAFGTRATPAGKMDIVSLLDRYEHIETAGIEACRKKGRPLTEHYLNGDAPLNALLDAVQQLKKGALFVDIFRSPQQQQEQSQERQSTQETERWN